MSVDPKDVREIFASEDAEWSDIRKERAIDMKYCAGDPWKSSERKLREEAGRPVLSLDELGQYHNQIVNDVRANPRGMQFAPTGNGANDKGARFYENKAREIEYRSQAQIAYTTAFENCICGSYGFVRVSTKYIHGEFFDEDTPADLSLFNQDLWIESIPNPDMVLPDSRAQRPDLRDQKRCFVREQWSTRDVERRFGKDVADRAGFWNTLRAPQWISRDSQTIAEYWDKAPTGRTRRLLHLKPQTKINPNSTPHAVYEDNYKGMDVKPSSDDIVTHRDIEQFAITQYLTNGFDILETKAWLGKYIPIAACLGKILYVPEGGDTARKILSLTRLARDPYMLYCYIRTCEAEAIGGIPRAQWVGYKGQFRGVSDEWKKANHEPVAYLEALGVVDGMPPGTPLLPLPQRQSWDPAIQGLEIAAEAARRAIQAAMNVSAIVNDPSQQLRDSSGTALKQREASAQKGAFHFVDHYDTMIETVGVYVEDLLDKIIDTARETGARGADGKSVIQAVNDPSNQDAISTKGDYLVTVTAGPTDVSERAAADDFVDSIAKNIGEIAQIAGPQAAKKILGMSVRLKDLGAEGDAIADVIDPPPPDGSKPPTPEMQALQQENAQLKQQTQEMQQAIATKQIEFTAQKDIESMRLDKTADKEFKLKQMDLDDKDKDRAAKIEAARISAAKGAIDPMAAAIEEHIALGTDLAHTSMEAERDRQHEREMAAITHAQALDAGAAAHQQGLESQQQQADLAPPPEEGA